MAISFLAFKVQGECLGSNPYTIYEIKIDRLALIMGDGSERVFPEALSSGRSNYMLFESLVRDFSGLVTTSGPDHKDSHNRTYEQKAYKDPEVYPKSKDLFRCSSSSTFPANNHGPKVKKFLEQGDYEAALQLCKETGYDKNDFYVFTNSGSFVATVPFRYFIIPKDDVVANLDSEDPRLISRSKLLSLVKSKVVLV